ncbi:carbohydrate binding domain-containing protein [Paenibacillus ferrarius]|uniref:carbohydrate binding domain-containing protein n=1 Tax=Paenibacillus ferrarius TaxID=1469647 RepID=UPI003D297265
MILKWRFISFILLFTMMTSVIIPWGAAPAYADAVEKNALLNPGFESGNRNYWGQYSSNYAAVSIQNTVKHEGNYSLQATFSGNTNLQLYQDVTGVPGQSYYYEAWVKSEGISPTGSQPGGFYPSLLIAAYNGSTWVTNPAAPAAITPNQDWTKVSGTFIFPSGANTIKLSLGRWNAVGAISGTLYVDDVFIGKTPDSLQAALTAPNFLVTDSVDLATQMNLTGSFNGSSSGIAPSSAVQWQVTGGSAVIVGNHLTYTGDMSGGDVSLQATFAGLEATVTVPFIRDPIAPVPGNIVLNGGFEAGNRSNWGQYSASFAAVTVQNAVKRGGSYGLQAALSGNTNLQLYQDMAGTPGKKYYYEAWVKSDGITPTGSQPTGFYPALQIAAYNNSSWVTNAAAPVSITPNQDWTKISGTFIFPAGANTIKLSLGRWNAVGAISGNLYIDDVYVGRSPDAIQLAMSKGSYKVTESVDLANQANLTGNYGGWLLPVTESDLVTWSVVAGSATIANNKLNYGGAPAGGSITLKGMYKGLETTVTVPFEPDVEAPVWGSNTQIVTTAKGRHTLNLTWPSASDNVGVTQYRLYQDAEPPITVNGNVYKLTVLEAGRSYHIEIEASDASDNWTNDRIAADISTRTLQEPDWIQGELTATDVDYSSLTLHWSGATDDLGVTQYRILQNGQQIAVTSNVYAYPVSGLLAETAYTFRVEAGDGSNNWTDNGPTLQVVTPYRSVAAAEVSVSESDVIRHADKELLGFNNDWQESQRVIMNQSPSLAIRDDYATAMQGLSLPLSRMGGTDSQYFKWKQTLGPYAQRTGFPNQWYPTTPMNFGIVEWLKSVQSVNMNSLFTWTFNMLQSDYAEDAADLAEFLTSPGDGTTNPNGGTDWGALRRLYGIADPVNVVFELGNELDHGLGMSNADYIQKCTEIIAAVRAVNPSAKFAALAKTAPWGDGAPSGTWRNWHNAVLQQLGSSIDYIAFHPYYLGNSIANTEAYLNYLRDDIHAWEVSNGSGHAVNVYISEHAVWPLRGTETDYSAASYRTHDLEGLLGTAQFINRMYNRPEITMAAYHALVSGPWFTLDLGSSGIYRTGIAEMMTTMEQALGTDVVKADVTGDYTNLTQDNNTFTVNAMTDDADGLRLVLVNRDARMKRDIAFEFEHAYKVVKKTVLTAPSLISTNTATSAPISAVTTVVTDEQALQNYLMPEKSMVVLYLEKLDAQP